MNPITSERLLIQPLTYADAKVIIRIRSIPEVSRYQGWEPKEVKEIHSLVDKMNDCGLLAPGQWFQFTITEKETQRLIGDCGIHPVASDRRQVEIGVTIDPQFQKMGYATEAIHSLLDFLFKQTDTHRASASIDPRNEPSIRLFEKLRFWKEAHLVESLWFKDEWVDDLIMAILRKEWLLPNKAFQGMHVSLRSAGIAST